MSDRDLKDTPLVSVIMPTFNRLKFVRTAIDSVLGQTYPNWELLVGDDGSAQDTKAYLGGLVDPRIAIVWLAHSGNPSRVRNAAIGKAKGTYLAFLDSDDFWEPNMLQAQVRTLRADTTRRWSYTANALMTEDGEPMSEEGLARWVPFEGNLVEPLLTIAAHLATSAVMAERDLVVAAGGFDEDQRFAEDYDLWLRLAIRSEAHVFSERLARVRVHRDHYSLDRVGAYEGWVRLYGKMARTIPDPRLAALAARRRAESTLTLAGLHVDAGRRRAALRTLVDAAGPSWRYPAWCWGAAKTMLRAGLPARLLSAYRQRLRRARAGVPPRGLPPGR
jgi:glycosyltransferase involved in cell wall biosynthesis